MSCKTQITFSFLVEPIGTYFQNIGCHVVWVVVVVVWGRVGDGTVVVVVVVFDCVCFPSIPLQRDLPRMTLWLFLEWSVGLVFRKQEEFFVFRIGVLFIHTHNLPVFIKSTTCNLNMQNNTVPIDGMPCCL